jgi:outer membrane protein
MRLLMLMPASHRLTVLVATMALACAPACASDAAASATTGNGCAGPSADCVPIGQWNFSIALGAGVRSNPLVHGQDLPLVLVPQFSYYGKRFFIDNLDLGYTLLETQSNTVSLIASPGYDRIFFYRSDLQNIFVGGIPTSSLPAGAGTGLPQKPEPQTQAPPRSRDVTYLAGPEWTFKTGIVCAQLDVLHEITGHNHGDEIRVAGGIALIDSRGSLTGDVGLTWKSEQIVNYYYGVPLIYRGGPAWDPFVKLAYSLPLTHKWHFIAFAQYEYLSHAIADSPIVAQHYVVTAFTGVVYSF